MSTSQLAIYNAALRLCGERRLSSLSEDRKPRHLLDDVWGDDGVRRCLEAGLWRFAMRSLEIEYDPDYDPSFGFQHAFDKPDDLVRVAAVCSDEYFTAPLSNAECIDEGGFWYSDLSLIYVRYVSDDDEFGMDFGKWPATFTEYVEAYFASKAVIDLTQDEKKRAEILLPEKGLLARSLMHARSNDAMKDGVKFPPPGSWTTARGRGRSRRNDPSGGQLIG